MTKNSHDSHQNSARYLIPIFLAWKILLILLATFSPGPGYDTSALILVNPSNHRHSTFPSFSRVDRLALNLFRWDALYFVKAAQRWYVYEQEWAFSWAFSRVLKTVGQYSSGDPSDSLQSYIWAGIVLSNVSHLISVLVLFQLSSIVLGPQQNLRVPFVASVLHLLSPAGLFLASPYTEALFSALNFTGMLQYALAKTSARSSGTWATRQDAYMLSAGILFASATLFRSNGLLSGLLFVYDVAGYLPRILTMQLSRNEARRNLVTCIAGMILGIGFISPQYLAYKEYCVTSDTGSHAPPWCDKIIPSIYSWVQSKYWNVGFLHYWTLSNLPLFLLAAPMLGLLLWSSVTTLHNSPQQPSREFQGPQPSAPTDPNSMKLGNCNLPELALPQFVLAIAATTNFHVQIINRISSGYPIWYLVVAEWIVDRRMTLRKARHGTVPEWIVRGMVMYGIIQGILFANFLPPA